MKDIVDFYTYMFKNFRNQVVPVTICVKSEKEKIILKNTLDTKKEA